MRVANEERRVGNGLAWLAVAALIAACEGSDSSVIPAATTPNLPPVCVLAAHIDVACHGTVTQFTLDGSASHDPEGERLAFAWTSDCPYIVFDDPTSATPLVTLATIECTVSCTATLVVDDGELQSSCVIVMRVAPDADAAVLSGTGAVLAPHTGPRAAPAVLRAPSSGARGALGLRRVWLQLRADGEPVRVVASDLGDARRVFCAGEFAPGARVEIATAPTDPAGLPPCVVIEVRHCTGAVERARLVLTPAGVELFSGHPRRLRLASPAFE